MPDKNDITFHPSSEDSVLITWPEKVCPQQHQLIMQYQQAIKAQLAHLVHESIASYNSLIIYYHFDLMSYQTFCEKLLSTYQGTITNQQKISTTEKRTIEIPVYYGEDAGWDLHSLSIQLTLPIDEIISLHTNRPYHAYALGFTPGFCYLASLDKQLQVARKAKPRLSIPAGAVAIAEQQTAIYPIRSPGGWHVIGQTPLAMFSTAEKKFLPSISVGQQVIFKSIDKEEFYALGGVLQEESQ